MASFPGGIYSRGDVTSTTPSSNPSHASLHNSVNAEITAIETVLGTNPQKDSTTVAARLDAIDVSLGNKAPSTGISPNAITGTAVIDGDTRLINSRTPTSHAATHGVSGTDAITIAPSQISQASATNGQALAWSTTATAWVPTTISAGGNYVSKSDMLAYAVSGSGVTIASADTTSVKSILGLTNGVALAANTTYAVDIVMAYTYAAPATTTNISFVPSFSGTLASVGLISRSSQSTNSANTIVNSANTESVEFHTVINSTTGTVINYNSQNSTMWKTTTLRGYIRTSTVGNFNPSIQLSVAPSSGNLTILAGTYVVLNPIYNTSSYANGTWS